MSELAVISDIHGNLQALKAVLEDIRNRGIREVICLGDVVGYGGNPAECIDLIRSCGIETIKGNHDEMVSGLPVIGMVREGIIESTRISRTQLKADQLQWLRNLPMKLEGDGYQAVHSSLYQPEHWNYVLRPDAAFLSMSKQTKSLCFIGHTHRPAFWVEGKEQTIEPTVIEDIKPGLKHVINVGSVGQPRDYDERACYVIYRPEKPDVMFVRLAYEIEVAQKAIRDAGQPSSFAQRLSTGR